VGQARQNTDERRFPPDDPNGVVGQHCSLVYLGIIGSRRFFIRY